MPLKFRPAERNNIQVTKIFNSSTVLAPLITANTGQRNNNMRNYFGFTHTFDDDSLSNLTYTTCL